MWIPQHLYMSLLLIFSEIGISQLPEFRAQNRCTAVYTQGNFIGGIEDICSNTV